MQPLSVVCKTVGNTTDSNAWVILALNKVGHMYETDLGMLSEKRGAGPNGRKCRHGGSVVALRKKRSCSIHLRVESRRMSELHLNRWAGRVRDLGGNRVIS